MRKVAEEEAEEAVEEVEMYALVGRCSNCSRKGSFIAPSAFCHGKGHRSSRARVGGGLDAAGGRTAGRARGRWGKYVIILNQRNRGCLGFAGAMGGGPCQARRTSAPSTPSFSTTALGRGKDRQGGERRSEECGRLVLRCAAHRMHGDVSYFHNAVCVTCGKRATFGNVALGVRPLTCAEHRHDSHVDICNPRCQTPGCTRAPSFGEPGGQGRARYCAAHCLPHHILKYHARCAHPSCAKLARYAQMQGCKPQFCREHRTQGCIDVLQRRCRHSGCNKIPTFVDPSKANVHPARFCARHKQPHFITLHQLAALRKAAIPPPKSAM